QIIDALHDDRIDAGLLSTPLERPSIKERVLFYEPFYLYVSADHPLAKKKTIQEKDLETSQIWLLEEGNCFRNQIFQICASKIKRNVLQNVHFESGNLETLKELVRKGMG